MSESDATDDAYADVSDLEAYWRPLSEDESKRAKVLLEYAGLIIEEEVGDREFNLKTARHVSLDMVKRAMIGCVGGEGVTSDGQSMSDMSVNRTYANPVGNLYMTHHEKMRLKGLTGQKQYSLSLSNNARVPRYPWTWQPSSQDEDAVYGAAQPVLRPYPTYRPTS